MRVRAYFKDTADIADLYLWGTKDYISVYHDLGIRLLAHQRMGARWKTVVSAVSSGIWYRLALGSDLGRMVVVAAAEYTRTLGLDNFDNPAGNCCLPGVVVRC